MSDELHQHTTQSGGTNFGQDNDIKITGDAVAGDKVGRDKVVVYPPRPIAPAVHQLPAEGLRGNGL